MYSQTIILPESGHGRVGMEQIYERKIARLESTTGQWEKNVYFVNKELLLRIT